MLRFERSVHGVTGRSILGAGRFGYGLSSGTDLCKRVAELPRSGLPQCVLTTRNGRPGA